MTSRIAALRTASLIIALALVGGVACTSSNNGAHALGVAAGAGSTGISSGTSAGSARTSSGATAAAGSSTSSSNHRPLTVVPTQPAKTLPPTPLRSTAHLGDGVTAQIADIKYGVVGGQGSGVLNGQAAVIFVVRMRNGSSKPIPVNTVQVVASYGNADTPAVPADQDTAKPLTGELKPGAVANGTYAFSIPAAGQTRVRIQVWYRQGQPTAVFTGSARA